jgi:hypothetical protein
MNNSLVSSNDLIKYLYVSYLVLNVVKFSSSFECMRTRLNAERMFIFVIYFALNNRAIVSTIKEIEYRFFFVIAFNLR